VLAPGVDIRSTIPGGGYATLSGTSMAAPHVAGACALLKALHRDWTPRQIKFAVMSTATPIAFAEPLAQGGGRIDAYAAANAIADATESSFDFGLDSREVGLSRLTRSITITNASRSTQLFDVSVSGAKLGLVATIEPQRITLEPGASATFVLAVEIDHAKILRTPESYAHGGFVMLTNGTSGLHLAWSVVTAARATFTFSEGYGSVYWMSGDAARQPAMLDSNLIEAVVPPGAYDYAAIGLQTFSVEHASIHGDIAIAIARQRATNTIVVNGTDQRGVPLALQSHYISHFRVFTPPSSPIRSFDIDGNGNSFAFGNLDASYSIDASELLVDAGAHRIVSVQYPPVRGDSVHTTLSSTAASLKRHPLLLGFPSAAKRRIDLWSVILADSFGAPDKIDGASIDTSDATWSGDLYVREEDSGARVSAIAITAGELNQLSDVETPPIRLRNGRFIASSERSPSPLAYSAAPNEIVMYGGEPAFARAAFYATKTAIMAWADIIGSSGEKRPRAASDAMTSIATSDGRVMNSGRGDAPLVTDTQDNDGPYAIAFDAGQLSVDATIGDDAVAPSITSMVIVDAAGRMASHFDTNAAGALVFTASGDLRTEQTRVWYRSSKEETWHPLNVVQSNADVALGTQFRADLTPAIASFASSIDLGIDLAAVSGSTANLTIRRAFTVEVPLSPPRRHAAGR